MRKGAKVRAAFLKGPVIVFSVGIDGGGIVEKGAMGVGGGALGIAGCGVAVPGVVLLVYSRYQGVN